MKNGDIPVSSFFVDPKIGHDKLFWKYCTEIDRRKIMDYKRSSNKKKDVVNMKCEKGHLFKTTPLNFFGSENKCPFCLKPGEKGVGKIAPEIKRFYKNGYDLKDISESCTEKFDFTCPFCKSTFIKTMQSMVSDRPRCKNCSDASLKESFYLPEGRTFAHM